jgi:hypothetical protein
MKKAFIFIFIFSSYAIGSYAQASSSANQNVALNLSNAIVISFVSGGTVTVPFASIADYVNGLPSSDQQIKVQSNKGFNVTMNANAENFTYSGSTTPAPVMPLNNVLYVEVAANNTGGSIGTVFSNHYGSVTTSPQTILKGCNNGGNQTFSVEYFTQPGFSYPAGTYTVNVIYTATQP